MAFLGTQLRGGGNTICFYFDVFLHILPGINRDICNVDFFFHKETFIYTWKGDTVTGNVIRAIVYIIQVFQYGLCVRCIVRTVNVAKKNLFKQNRAHTTKTRWDVVVLIKFTVRPFKRPLRRVEQYRFATVLWPITLKHFPPIVYERSLPPREAFCIEIYLYA